MRPYKLLILNHAVEIGGAEKVLLRFLDFIDRDLFEPTLACPEEGPLVQEMRARNIAVELGHPSQRLLDIKRRSLGSNRLRILAYPFDFLNTSVKLAWLIRKGGFDLVLTNSAKADIYGSIAARLARRPVVWRLHDIVSEEAFNRLNMTLFRICASLFARRILAVSEAVREALLDLGVAGGKVSVIYNGIDMEATHECNENTRTEWGIAADARLAGLVGRLVDWKGPDRFLQAAALVREDVAQARFMLVGDAIFGEKSYAEDLKSLCSRLELDEAVVFTGFREDVIEIMACLDVLVHTSILPDPLPTVLIEAMSLGLPVIAADGGGVREIVEDRVTGLVVPPGDPGALADAITGLLSNRELARRMGRMGREKAEALFDIRKTASEMQKQLSACVRGVVKC
ncbi:MAG: hypothetical protein A2W01_02065 [Candidatus Solincola sediminis]|uniref:Glycosyltransferase family 1 protein n=1 Tax=Candidatus Solincola sediminis TaxID=1797199 RepID=A0A1F2WJ15_9ACTN|nr:MAG: hypothetical protein A2Y75_06735 [Candidatus Solincola sediminis]OFW57563.1 MAG: hypothetical protein A2W01_02065 [Candidatus Solincola sediminis]